MDAVDASGESQVDLSAKSSGVKWDEQGPLPPTDYYIYDEYEWMAEGKTFLESNDLSPVSRNAIEIAYKVFLERDLKSYFYSNYEPERNSSDDRQVDIISLTRRPPCFVIFGKPGIGRTTIAAKLAEKLNSVHINAKLVIEYYISREPLADMNIKEILETGGTIDDIMIMKLFDRRIKEMDVLHRGYILDDIPFLVTEQISIKEQMKMLESFVLVPDFAIMLYMQDVDLYKRRIEQKIDFETQKLYTKAEYENVITLEELFKSTRKVPEKQSVIRVRQLRSITETEGSESTGKVNSMGSNTNSTIMISSGKDANSDVDGQFQLYQKAIMDGSVDFPPISFSTSMRLVSRLEDNSILVNDELEKFRNASMAIQDYIDKLDKRKTLEVNAYWFPSVIFKNVWNYIETYGIAPAAVPTPIMRKINRVLESYRGDEEYDEDYYGDVACEPDESLPNIDWDASYKAVSLRGTIDPRFRWRLSPWKNLCPVALKLGKSIAGRPELAVNFLDKAYYLSSQEAVDQFVNNPRPFLLPEMPTSPIKFFVIGHPLSGKTLLVQDIAKFCQAEIVDMKMETERRYDQVRFDYLQKKKIQITFDAIRIVERENKVAWKRGERYRRTEMHAWIDRHLRGITESQIGFILEEDRLIENRKYLAESYFHKISDPPYHGGGSCQEDHRFAKLCWRKFILEVRQGKLNWTHQERLELAFDLFRQGRLYYKMKLKPRAEKGDGESASLSLSNNASRQTFEEFLEEGAELSDEELGSEMSDFKEASDSLAEDVEDFEDFDDDLQLLTLGPRKAKKKCKVKKKKEIVIDPEVLDELTPTLSSILDADEELEESVLLRFPMIPLVLVETVVKPHKVNEKDPMVNDIIQRRFQLAQKNANEAEIYLEVMRRAILDAEVKYRVKNLGGPLTGGWVVDNISPDIEKWRLILRTHDVAPDQVLVLIDHSPTYIIIYDKLKKMYRKLHPKIKVAEDEVRGEEEPGEGEKDELEIEVLGSTPSDVNFRDDLLGEDEMIEDSPSMAMLLARDANRQRSIAGSQSQSFENILLNVNEEDKVKAMYRKDIGTPENADEVDSSISKRSISKPKTKKDTKQVNFEMGAYITESQKNMQCQDENLKSKTETQDFVPHEGFEYTDKIPIEPEKIPKKSIEKTLEIDILKKENEDEIEGEREDIKIDEANRTPSGLISSADVTILCPEGGGPEDDERTACLVEKEIAEKLRGEKGMSGKRRFLMEIREFELFWNMVIPVLHEQEIRYWEMGVVDESSAREKISTVWHELQGRFADMAKKVTKVELDDDEIDARESLRRWGEHAKTINQIQRDMEEDEEEGELDDVKSEGLILENADLLAPLEAKPDVYRMAVENIESMRIFGDFKDFCPVTFYDIGLLQKGFPTHAAKYRDRLYYFNTEINLERFLATPATFVLPDGFKKRLVPRICVTGPPGNGQEEVALKLSNEYGICYVNFRQRLHELIKARFGYDVGPGMTGSVITSNATDRMLAAAQSSDDLMRDPTTDDSNNFEVLGEDYGESIDLYKHYEQYKEGSIHDVTIQTLGLLDIANVATNPMASIQRTEMLKKRKWKKLTKKETQIKAFLENGIQLPDSILDEFIVPLWRETPFSAIGFILVGFPNTEQDFEYLVNRRLFPEHVFIMESNPLAIRNRLLVETVDRWHLKNNPSGKKKVDSLNKAKRLATKNPNPPPKPETTTKRKKVIPISRHGSEMKTETGIFEYQTEGRKEEHEYVEDTWSYNDETSRNISAALRHYHFIYSKDLLNLKKSLNKNRIDWTPFATDLSIIASKAKLTEKITSMLKYRSSFLEVTVPLNIHQADALLCGGYYELSKFRRWCPVEVFKGNKALNMWNSDIKKIPILHRRYIYFLAGEKNARIFRENVLEFINQAPISPTFPLTLVINGYPKSGKTTTAKKISQHLGFTYVSGTSMVENILKHTQKALSNRKDNNGNKEGSFNAALPMTTAEETLCYLENGKEIPNFMMYRILDLVLMDAKAQHHGIVYDDYPVDQSQLHDLVERGTVPSVVAKLNLSTEERYARNARKSVLTHDYKSMASETLEFIQISSKIYQSKLKSSYDWFQYEFQSLYNVDSSQSPHEVFREISEHCIKIANLLRNYIVSIQHERPCALEGTCPLTSDIPSKLSPIFDHFCPVALNDNEELSTVTDLTNLRRIVEYGSELYAFSTDEFAQKFIKDPLRYLPPNCARVPPKHLPMKCEFTAQEFEKLKESWGFEDFDSVMYALADFHPKALQRGLPKYVVQYRGLYYTFINEINQTSFMKKPTRYSRVPLPSKLPKKFEPLDLDKISRLSYMAATGLIPELKKVINLLGTKRPRVPFMSSDRSCALYMAYYFKSLNMNTPFEVRQKYRGAMFQMMNHKMNCRDLLRDLKTHYGTRFKKLPEKLIKSLDEFLELAHKKDEEKVLMPTIPDLPLNYKSALAVDDEELSILVSELMEGAKKAEQIEKEMAFRKYVEKKEAEINPSEQFY